MKLKKMLSLMLGGVMALSMLTACGSSSGSSDDLTLTGTPATNNGVVAYIQANMRATEVGDNQASVTLSGNEAEDLEYAVKQAKNGTLSLITLTDVDRWVDIKPANDSKYPMNASNATSKKVEYSDHQTAGETYAFMVAKNGNSDSDLGDRILHRMKRMYEITSGKNGSPHKNYYIYDKISVFDATFTTNQYVNNLGTLTVGGTTVLDGSYDYWVVVVHVSEGKTDTTADFD